MILHICCYYYTSQLYPRLFRSIGEVHDGEQRVVVPTGIRRKTTSDNTVLPDRLTVSNFRLLGLHTKLIFPLKVLIVYLAAWSRVYGEVSRLRVIHAHTLYADGFGTWLLAKSIDAPYVITIRNTDVNLGFKYLRYMRPITIKVLTNCRAIVFVSPSYIKRFENEFGNRFSSKYCVCPNGLQQEYIDNARTEKAASEKGDITIGICVCKASTNKNIRSSVLAFAQAVERVHGKEAKALFRIVGATKEDCDAVFGSIDAIAGCKIEYHDIIDDWSELARYYDKADVFVMASHAETFGLVYLEAVSRCLPLVYTAGTGIDGVFDDRHVGFAVNSNSTESISAGVESCLRVFPHGLGPFAQNPVTEFDWSVVARKLVGEAYQVPLR